VNHACGKGSVPGIRASYVASRCSLCTGTTASRYNMAATPSLDTSAAISCLAYFNPKLCRATQLP
jgi:hypothetical protein